MDVESTRQSMTRRPVRKADEVDAFSRLHRAHKFRSGQSARSAVKERYTRRERRGAKRELRSRI